MFCTAAFLINILSCEFIASVFASQGDLKNAVVIEEKAEAEAANVKGIPDFWFTIFRNVDMLSELVQVSFSPEKSKFCHVPNEVLLFPINSVCGM